jgi:hypothetical protein
VKSWCLTYLPLLPHLFGVRQPSEAWADLASPTLSTLYCSALAIFLCTRSSKSFVVKDAVELARHLEQPGPAAGVAPGKSFDGRDRGHEVSHFERSNAVAHEELGHQSVVRGDQSMRLTVPVL